MRETIFIFGGRQEKPSKILNNKEIEQVKLMVKQIKTEKEKNEKK